MIIDCHTHLNRYTPEEPADLAERFATLKTEMRSHGVDYALILSSYAVTPERPSVDEILEVVRDDEQIGVVAGISYYAYRSSDLAHLRVLLRSGRVKALKLYPGYEAFYVHDPRMRVVYELAEEFSVPVMIHAGDTFDPKGKLKYAHPLEVDEVAVDFPGVTFVICHLGNPWVTDAMEVIYKNENVVGDISGLTLGRFEERFERYMLQQLNEVVTFAGDPSSILYGTDWPICEMGSYLRFVRNLDLSEGERELILSGNAMRVFGIPDVKSGTGTGAGTGTEKALRDDNGDAD
ncbi:MAG TPA: amidohydrolase family protein [Longimicrobiaceae bacterium]|nr:amidohydrolase family protein [Longimicrobiaceae bacterium]